MPLDSSAAGFAGADGADNMVGFAAVVAFDDMRGGLVGWISFAAIFLHNWSFAGATFAAGIGAASRTGHVSHSKRL